MTTQAETLQAASNFLNGIIKGKQPCADRLVLYGIEGIGKSSLAATAEKPIFIPTEKGTANIDCERFPMATTWDAVIENLRSLYREKHPYKTVVIDTLTSLEGYLHDVVVADADDVKGKRPRDIEEVGGGFHKGYVACVPHWRKLTIALDAIHDKGMNVLLLAHTGLETIDDPEQTTSYKRTVMGLNKHAAAVVAKWADAILFYSCKMRVEKIKKGFNQEKAVALTVGPDGGERYLRTVGSPACMAKNRYRLPSEIPIPYPPNFRTVLDLIEAGKK